MKSHSGSQLEEVAQRWNFLSEAVLFLALCQESSICLSVKARTSVPRGPGLTGNLAMYERNVEQAATVKTAFKAIA